MNLLQKIIEENPEFYKKLPRYEQNLYDYYIIKGMNQKDIAKILHKTQGSISSRLSKMKRRLVFMCELKPYNVTYEALKGDLSKDFTTLEIEILWAMYETTCQSETATRINYIFNLKNFCEKMNQVKIRHRFGLCLDKLKTLNSIYYQPFNMIKNNLYALHEVKLPHFTR
jgi:hypothetical protein